MSREIFTPEKFQPVPGYKDLTPQEISHNTTEVIDLYFSGIGFNMEPGRDFLVNYTLNHLRAAEQGFFTSFDKRRFLTKADSTKIFNRGQEVLAQEIDEEASLAFGHTLVVFAHLSNFEDPAFYLAGFSRSMTLASPSTSQEVLSRIHELQFSVAKIASGNVERSPLALQGSSQLVRTYAFFKVGDELIPKFSEEQIQRAAQLSVKEALNRLTSDISGLDSF